MSQLPKVLQYKGILTNYKDYEEGTKERAIAFLREMMFYAQHESSLISGWDLLKSHLLIEGPRAVLGFKEVGPCMHEVLGDLYELIEYGKVKLDPKQTVQNAVAVGKAAKARCMRDAYPHLSQEAIAKAVGCSQQNVGKALNTTLVQQCGTKVVLPAHIKDRNHQADFRKLSADLQSQVISRTISLNRACIQAGIRVKLSPLDVAKKAVLALSDADWQAVKLWINAQ